MSPRGPLDDKQEYMSWLERMWDVQRFDIPGRTEREESRTEEVLGVFRGIGELSRRHVEPSDPPSWEATREKRPVTDDARELEAAGWERFKRQDGEDVWLDPGNGFVYSEGAAIAVLREGADSDVSEEDA